MKISVIQGKELDRLVPVLVELGWPMPACGASRAIIAEEDGRVIGFAIVQLLPHLEPVWVETSHRGNGLADEIVQKAAEVLMELDIPHWISLVRNDQSKRLAEAIGMTKAPGEVYVK